MSKGLEAFYDLLSPIGMTSEGIKKFNIIEKDLEVLEIIKKKRVDVNFLYRMLLEYGGLPYNTYGDDKKALKEYNECNETKLTETEFNLIKEWLER